MAGQLIIHATLDEKTALESAGISGGEFNLALLQSIHKFQRSAQEGLLPWETVIDHASSLLTEKGTDKFPEIGYQAGSIRTDFT